MSPKIHPLSTSSCPICFPHTLLTSSLYRLFFFLSCFVFLFHFCLFSSFTPSSSSFTPSSSFSSSSSSFTSFSSPSSLTSSHSSLLPHPSLHSPLLHPSPTPSCSSPRPPFPLQPRNSWTRFACLGFVLSCRTFSPAPTLISSSKAKPKRDRFSRAFRPKSNGFSSSISTSCLKAARVVRLSTQRPPFFNAASSELTGDVVVVS